jgi:hypothetical protein
MGSLNEFRNDVQPAPKLLAKRHLRAVKSRPLSFATWFAQQMQRSDGVGQIARDFAGGPNGAQSFREIVETILWAGPSFTDDDIDAACQARREYLVVNGERT